MGDLSSLFLGPYVSQQPPHNLSNSSQPSKNNDKNNVSLVSNSNSTLPSSQEDSQTVENDPFDVVLSVTIALLYDPVASVRQALLHQVLNPSMITILNQLVLGNNSFFSLQIPKILQVLENFPEKRQLLDELKKLPSHSNYQFRQM
jgi:hypothetical protein